MGRFVWVVFLPFFAIADDVTFKLEEGKPVEVKFAPDRSAEWLVARRPPTQFRTKFKITENTCNERDGQGSFLLGFQFVEFSLRWKIHPNAEKVGKDVTIRPKDAPVTQTFFAVNDQAFLSNDDKKTAPIAAAEIPSDLFESSDFSWIPGSGTASPETVELLRWGSEGMFPNPETGLFENRVITVATHVKLTRKSDTQLELREWFSNTQGGRLTLFAGDIWSIILKDGEDFCQISQKANLGDLVTEVGKYLMAPVTYAPYLFGVDEYSKVRMPSGFKNFMENWKKYDVE